MKTKITYISIIVLLIGVIIYLLTQDNIQEERVEIKTTIEKIPVKVETPVYVPKWRTKVETITEFQFETDTFQAPIDTNEILKDYYSKYAYQDTVTVDTFGNIVISDTITRNYIIARKVQSNLEIPKITIEKTIYLNNREWYVGVGVVGSPRQLGYIGGEILYRTKKRKAIGIGMGINQNLIPQGSFKLLWKLGK